eukprot:gnl/TRDRNA2_/TRDRNA2_90374_c0_seq1.p1 gnl/TRDRNA2_/TRDRNA2_90374_c0~~gnl/TRDRNA2_/TRDRNA2_90374_c0_seq1.p1  ORF type:complete len:505 (+),score=158.25 gnl/TRDRNA2_/TRDRNA2_90374_c0_seq1:170-1516(+)
MAQPASFDMAQPTSFEVSGGSLPMLPLPQAASMPQQQAAMPGLPAMPAMAAGSQAGSSMQMPNMMALQNEMAAAQKTPQGTYTNVRKMVDQMAQQMSSVEMDESKHREWCDSEITKNDAVASDKKTKLQRLSTKIDNEKEMVGELDQDLQLLAEEAQTVQGEIQQYARVRMAEGQNYAKAAQNRQMAEQILNQATMILQRFGALAQDAQQQGSAFLQAGGGQQVSAASSSAIDALSQTMAHYEQLGRASDMAENQAKLDTEKFQELNKNLLAVLGQTRSYKSSLRLQSMSELDADKEDQTALVTQVESVTQYVNRLRQACADILMHYDERKVRRQQSMKALDEARGAITANNVEDAGSKLTDLASSIDNTAANLLASSQVMPSGGLQKSPRPEQQMQQQMPAQQPAALSAPQQSPLAGSILGDLKSLQDLNADANPQNGDKLNMVVMN